MAVRRVTPILNVSDVTASIEWFEALGWERRFTWPRGSDQPGFAGVGSDGAEIFLCRDAQGSRGGARPAFVGDTKTDGVWMSWWVESPAEVDALHAFALEHDLDVSYPPTDEPWGVRELHLRHPDGHTFRVGAPIDE